MRVAGAALLGISLAAGCAERGEHVARTTSAPVAPRIARPSATAASPARSPAAAPAPPSDPRLTFAFGGDVIAHDAIRSAAERAGGYDELLGAAAPPLREADLAFVNLESPVTERVIRRGEMIFHADEPILDALGRAGVDLLSLANNHAFDQGPAGIADTLAAVGRRGFVGLGAAPSLKEACAPTFLESKSFKIAFLARTLVMNFHDGGGKNAPAVCMLAEGPLKRHVRAARAEGAELVVASLHWGNEYERAPRQEQIDAAKRIVDAGVDLLIGHHPHVLQRVSRMRARGGREALVAYSLGNLLSNQGHDFDPRRGRLGGGDTRDGAILKVSISRGEDGRPRLDDVSAIPLWTEHDPGGEIRLVPAASRRDRIARTLRVPLL